tara:strand:- start:42 stop:515 length:474 start_codon:yes stop_codon:yes gene_type:complete
MTKIGIGYDVHRLEKNKPFFIGGIKIESEFGSVGHSDGDALIHAIVDAVLGAAGLGDIGIYFPSDEVSWKGVESSIFLKEAVNKIEKVGYKICNVDTTIVLENPKLNNYFDVIKNKLASVMKIDKSNVNIKATTTDGLGHIGKGNGWSALAVVTLKK